MNEQTDISYWSNAAVGDDFAMILDVSTVHIF